MKKSSALAFIASFTIICLLLTGSVTAQNVGIGTTTPATTLHVKSTVSNPVIFDGGSNTTWFTIAENGLYRGYWGSYAGNPEDVDFGTYSGNTTGKVHLTIQSVPKFTIDQNGRIIINNNFIPHGLFAIKATADSEAIYINQASAPTNYGTLRVEYTGSTDANRVGILSTTIKSTSDQNGTGIEGAGNSIGVQGLAEASTASPVEGIEGDSYGSGAYSMGVAGYAYNYSTAPTNNYGVYGYAYGGATNYAVYSDGNMRVNGSISKASGTFEIDHPLDPANKYLYHSFVESPDMMNIYNGNITTGMDSIAVVALPDYFDTLNKDFRYQLTVIGTFAQAIVSKEVNNNSFEIKTNQPNIKVSWQVTGVRQDAWANAHRVVPEVEKESFNKGKYLHPTEFGLPDSLRIGTSIKHAAKNNNILSANNDDLQTHPTSNNIGDLKKVQ